MLSSSSLIDARVLLIGRGDVEVAMTVDGGASNVVEIRIN
jgi:hypothetical protein